MQKAPKRKPKPSFYRSCRQGISPLAHSQKRPEGRSANSDSRAMEVRFGGNTVHFAQKKVGTNRIRPWSIWYG